jgi:CHAD domain-containing protein
VSTFEAAPDLSIGEPWQRTGEDEHYERYYDTAELNLTRAGFTVLRTDTEWQLRAGSSELIRPVGRVSIERGTSEERSELTTLPNEFANLLAPWAPDGLHEVLRLRIARSSYRSGELDGEVPEVVAELFDDEVYTHPNGIELVASRWRQLSLKSGPIGSAKQLKELSDELVGDGAVQRPDGHSNLAIAVFGHPLRSAQPSAGDVIGDYLRAQCDALAGGHLAVSTSPFDDAPDTEPPEAIHKTRVATRRLRAALKTFGALFDTAAVAQLEEELVYYAGVLGPVRDLEVLRSRLSRAVADLPVELVIGPVAEQIDSYLRQELDQAVRALLASYGTARYRALVLDLARWRTEPPFTEPACERAGALAGYVRAAERSLSKRLSKAHADSQDEKLHSARKAGKRLRYAAEAARPVLGKQAGDLATYAEHLQTVLGEHQDAVVAQEVLLRIAEQVYRDGQNPFSYGVLAARQHRLAIESVAAARQEP